jgi:hypothetical protein
VRRATRAAGVLAIALAAACASEEKEIKADRRYVSTVYNDTVLETFGRTTRTITGMLIEKSGDTVRFRIHTNADALVSNVDLTLHPSSQRGQRPATRIVTMPKGTLPLMQNSVAFLEQYLRRARTVGGDSVSIPVMLVGASPELEVLTLVKIGADSVMLLGPDMKSENGIHLALDAQDRIAGGVMPLSGARITRADGSQ